MVENSTFFEDKFICYNEIIAYKHYYNEEHKIFVMDFTTQIYFVMKATLLNASSIYQALFF